MEGKFFVWTPAQVAEVLGERDAAVFGEFYDVTAGGNWEDVNILRVVKDARDVAKIFNLTLEETAQILDGGKAKLLEARESRIKPLLDDKALTAWNGLMLAAFAECGAIFERQDFIAAAVKNANFVLNKLSNLPEDGDRWVAAPEENLPQWRSEIERIPGRLRLFRLRSPCAVRGNGRFRMDWSRPPAEFYNGNMFFKTFPGGILSQAMITKI